MKISRVLHHALLITDLERAKQFYEGVLGLQQKTRPNFRFPGLWYDLGGLELHLIVTEEQLTHHTARRDRDFHVALAIEDFDATKQELIDAGIPFGESTHPLAQLFLRDPDGNLIELQKVDR